MTNATASMDEAAVVAWLEAGLGRRVDRVSVVKFPRGVSRETWLVSCDAGHFTIRQDLPGGSVDPVPLRQEYEVYRRLAQPGGPVPVAKPLWYTEVGPAGRPAYAREQVHGHWQIDGWPDPAVKKAAGQEHLRKLAALHTCDWRALGFGEIFEVPASPADCAPLAVEYFAREIDDHLIEPIPLVHETIAFFREAAPKYPAPRIALCKGTNGLGEEVWHDGKIVAMSDWELARLCDPAYDLAQCQDLLWDETEALAFYNELTGIGVTLEHVNFYRNLYSLTMFAFTNHAAKCMVQQGDRNARLCWVGTEMSHVATMRMAFAAGFAPPREERSTVAQGGR
jgi:aminoglycoside phosphotransferase (APT) family kinase protein